MTHPFALWLVNDANRGLNGRNTRLLCPDQHLHLKLIASGRYPKLQDLGQGIEPEARLGIRDNRAAGDPYPEVGKSPAEAAGPGDMSIVTHALAPADNDAAVRVPACGCKQCFGIIGPVLSVTVKGNRPVALPGRSCGKTGEEGRALALVDWMADDGDVFYLIKDVRGVVGAAVIDDKDGQLQLQCLVHDFRNALSMVVHRDDDCRLHISLPVHGQGTR